MGLVMNLTDHFTLEELTFSQTADRLGLDNTPSPDIIVQLTKTSHGLEMIRTLLQAPIHINSGYRSIDVNKAVGSSSTSQHVLGQAVDFIAPQFGRPRDIVEAIRRSRIHIPFDQLILEFNSWVHVSFSPRTRGEMLIIDKDGTRPYA